MTASDVIRETREGHRLISAHRCICKWEGDDAFTHVIDVLGLEHVGWDNPASWPMPFLRITGVPSPEKETPIFRLRGATP